MTSYPRTSYSPNENISISARGARGIGERRDYGSSVEIHEDYGVNDGDRDYSSRSKLHLTSALRVYR